MVGHGESLDFSLLHLNTRNFFNLIQPLRINGKENAFIGINKYLITVIKLGGAVLWEPKHGKLPS